MSYYAGRIAEERRLQERELENHIRLCNAGVNQTRLVFANEEERKSYNERVIAWWEKKYQSSEILENFGLTKEQAERTKQ